MEEVLMSNERKKSKMNQYKNEQIHNETEIAKKTQPANLVTRRSQHTKCSATDQNCNSCRKKGHFAQACR